MFAKIATAVAIGAATVAFAAPNALAATPTHQVGTKLSQTYEVVNATSEPLTIVGTHIDGDWDGAAPIEGTVVQPGTTYSFGLVRWLSKADVATVNFRVGDTGKYLLAIAAPYGIVGPDGNATDYGFDASRMDGNTDHQYTSSIDGFQDSVLTLQSSKPTVHTLTDGQGQLQYEAFNTLCATGNSASCTFHATGEQKTFGDPVLVGSLLDARDMPIEETMGWSHTTEMTTKWDTEASLSVGVEGLVTAEVKASYGQDLGTSDEASNEFAIHVKKGYVGWLTYEAPVERVTGDFTITLGNDTWHLSDVHFDLPLGTKGTGSGGQVIAQELPEGNPGIPSSPAFLHHR